MKCPQCGTNGEHQPNTNAYFCPNIKCHKGFFTGKISSDFTDRDREVGAALIAFCRSGNDSDLNGTTHADQEQVLDKIHSLLTNPRKDMNCPQCGAWGEPGDYAGFYCPNPKCEQKYFCGNESLCPVCSKPMNLVSNEGVGLCGGGKAPPTNQMTVWDHYAIAAMSGYNATMSHGKTWSELASDMADRMLAERKKRMAKGKK